MLKFINWIIIELIINGIIKLLKIKSQLNTLKTRVYDLE
jgi:hypothetical protein